MDIQNLTVVGAGAMGSQIAMVGALAGLSVALVDVSEEMLAKARAGLHEQMDKRVAKGRLTAEAVEAAFERLQLTNDLEAAAKHADYVIEAIVEKLDVKRALFAQLDGIAPEHAIFATNSSTIVSSKLASATKRPEKVCNMHFFNPALVMQLVEVVRHEQTSDETIERTVELTKRMGKTPVRLNREISGFVVNRILGAIMDEAVDLYEQGIASFEDIDKAVTLGLNHPIGPFALMDLTGIDVNYFVRMQRYQETGDPADAPKQSIAEKFERGELGRKTGRGWYTYDK